MVEYMLWPDCIDGGICYGLAEYMVEYMVEYERMVEIFIVTILILDAAINKLVNLNNPNNLKLCAALCHSGCYLLNC